MLRSQRPAHTGAARPPLRRQPRAAPSLVRAAADTVLVTGGGGFVGSHAAQALLRRGARRATPQLRAS